MKREETAGVLAGWKQYQGAAIALLLIVSLLAVSQMAIAAQAEYALAFGGPRETSELRLSIGKSQLIHSRESLEQVVIGNPGIADINLLSSTQVLILGKQPGHTNLVFRGKKSGSIAVMDVVVGYDLDGIKRKIYEILPQENLIEIRGANDAVTLSGEVSSLLAMDKAIAIASSYVPRDKVINLLQVGGGQQVMLEVKISEIARNSLRELGVELEVTDTDAAGRALTVVTGESLANPFFSAGYTNPDNSIADLLTVKLQALETKGLAKTLAEPNIVALSGQEASFLAGGELPIPIAQTSGLAGTVITVDYKEFGVGLKFTPTVLSSGKINLKLNSEVSAIDSSIGTETGAGILIPGISTRRTGTTIEAGNGQSFAIAGLLQSDMNNALNEVPGLGDIPILGALFRSTKFQRNETELVVVVTPRLVKPVHATQLKYPTDNFVPPNAFQQYLMGRLEGPPPKKKTAEGEAAESNGATETQNGSAEGVEGSFGHEL